MLIYGLMKYVESVPLRYDKVMNVLTLGRHGQAREILLNEVKAGMEVLDIGCGTGVFALAAAEKGAKITCVDASASMLRIFRQRISQRPDLEPSLDIRECGAASIGHVLEDRRFDLVTASLMLGELPASVRTHTIRVSGTLLKDGGRFVVCDEFWPRNPFLSVVYHLLFWIFFIPNFLLTRTLIQPVKGFDEDISSAGLVIAKRYSLLMGAMAILWLEPGATEGCTSRAC